MIIMGVILFLMCFFRVTFDVTENGHVLLWYGIEQRNYVYLFMVKNEI